MHVTVYTQNFENNQKIRKLDNWEMTWVLIISDLQSNSSYVVSIFLISTSIDEIQKMMNSFWWKHGEFFLWWDLYFLKVLQLLIRKCLAKNLWLNQTFELLRLFKVRYFLRSNFHQSSFGHNPNYGWHSIWSAKFIVCIWHLCRKCTIQKLEEYTNKL
jgi:hypothetical protein